VDTNIRRRRQGATFKLHIHQFGIVYETHYDSFIVSNKFLTAAQFLPYSIGISRQQFQYCDADILRQTGEVSSFGYSS